MAGFAIRPLAPADREWVREKSITAWGAEIVVAHGEVLRPAELPGFAAEIAGKIVGLLTYAVRGDECEITTLNAWRVGLGIGATLIEAAKGAALRAGCRRLWLVTTNDNTSGLRFYQKCGFVLCALRVNAIAASRNLKPEIPLTGEAGIPIRDEIELEIWL
jgi:ribosomal protein S18 acetylase RimI-like enzyme